MLERIRAEKVRANQATGGKSRTRGRRPFTLVYAENFTSRHEARKRERYFKTAAGRRFLDRIVQSEDQTANLVSTLSVE